MRILHIVSSTSRSSGVMHFIMNYYPLMKKKNIYFDFMYFYDVDTNYNEEILKLGGRLYNIGTPKLSIGYKKKVNKFFKSNQGIYTAIHCHPIFSFFFFGFSAKKHGINHIIQHSHTTNYSNKKISSIRNRLLIKLAPLCVTEYASCSKDALHCLPKKDLLKKRYIIINNAFDLDEFKYNEKFRKEIRKELKINDNDVVICHVGRFSSEKNHELIIQIFNEYHKINNKSKLVLCGIGPLLDKMKNYSKTLQLSDCILFVGVRNDINKVLSACDFFVFPSLFEGLGIAAIEAQVSGLVTIVSNNVPKIACISNQTYRFNIEEEDISKKIADKMILIGNYERINNIELIKNHGFDISTEANKLFEFYNDLDLKIKERR